MTGFGVARRDRRAARRAGRAPGQPAAGQRLLRARPPGGRGPHDRAAAGRPAGVLVDRARPADEPARAAPAESRTRTRTRYAIGPDFDDPELDKDLWRFRRIAARGLFEPGAYPSDITLVNWPQIDYTDAPVLDGSRRGRPRAQPPLPALDADGSTPGCGCAATSSATRPTGSPRRRTCARRAGSRRCARWSSRTSRSTCAARTAPRRSPTPWAIGHYRIDLHPSTGGDPYLDLACCPFQLPLCALSRSGSRT